MNNKQKLSIAVIVAAVIGLLVMIKLLPFWATIISLAFLAVGFVAGYLYKKPEVVTEVKEVIKEVVKEIPAKKTKKAKE